MSIATLPCFYGDTPAVVDINFELNEVSLKPTKGKAKTKLWDNNIKEITSAMCAFFNSCYGGVLRLNFDNQRSVTEPKAIDDIVRRIEQIAKNLVGGTIATVSAFKLLNTKNTAADGLEFFVKPAFRFCTVEYNLYLPSEYQVSAITFGDSSAEVASLLEPQSRTFQIAFKEHCDNFVYKEKVPDGLREGQTVQFKLLKNDSTSRCSLADRMTNKSNKLVMYVSAFANHEGGNLYFGIDDTTYLAEGQVANVKEREKVRNRLDSVLSKMIWPETPHQRYWSIQFVPVCESINGEERRDTFVIVLSVAKCPGGVFVEQPESYQLENGIVVKIPLPLWKKKVREDAKGCRGSYRRLGNGGRRDAVVPITSVDKGISAIGWNSVRQKDEYMEVMQVMENLVTLGDWKKVEKIAAKVLTPENSNIDLKLAVTFYCSFAACRQGKHQDTYMYLNSCQALVSKAKNPAIFEVQELYSWCVIKGCEENYKESYRFVHDGFQKIQLIVPGWNTAWFYCVAAALLTMFASEESDAGRKEAYIGEAECCYRKALAHVQTISSYKKLAADLKHRIHVYLALLYLESSPPSININNCKQTISLECLRSAEESLKAAEDFEDLPMSSFTEFYFMLAKSDLYLRYFQRNDSAEHAKKAIRYANDAYKFATDNGFAEVLHYAESRIALLESISLEAQDSETEVVDELLRNFKLLVE